MYGWAKLPQTPVMWPVQVVSSGDLQTKVYAHSDHAEFYVNNNSVFDFNIKDKDFEEIAKRVLTKKPATYRCFIKDLEIAKINAKTTEDWDSEIQDDPLTLTAVYVSPCLYKSTSSMKNCVDFQKKYPLSLKRVNLKKEQEKEKEVITEHVWNPQGTQQRTDGKAFAKENEDDNKETEKAEDEEDAESEPEEEEEEEKEEETSTSKKAATKQSSRKSTRKRKSSTDANVRTAHFMKGEFLAVRNETDGYYMCKACQNVYESTKKFKVYWMTDVPDSPHTYKFEYVEFIHGDYRCVISQCKMKKVDRQTFQLPQNEVDKIERILRKGIDRQKGIESESSGSGEEEDEEEELEHQEEVKETPKSKEQASKKSPPKKEKTPRKPKEIPYEITVWTGDIQGAGTDANVSIQMYGESGKSVEYKLRNKTDNFQQCEVDKFKIEAEDVGPLLKVRIRHDGKGMVAGWYLDKLLIQRHPTKMSKRRKRPGKKRVGSASPTSGHRQSSNPYGRKTKSTLGGDDDSEEDLRYRSQSLHGSSLGDCPSSRYGRSSVKPDDEEFRGCCGSSSKRRGTHQYGSDDEDFRSVCGSKRRGTHQYGSDDDEIVMVRKRNQRRNIIDSDSEDENGRRSHHSDKTNKKKGKKYFSDRDDDRKSKKGAKIGGKKSVDTDSEGERKYGRNLDQRKGGKKGDKDDEDEEVEEYWFVCKRWFAESEDDKKIVRELLPTDELGNPLDAGLEEIDYVVTVYTGDVRGAGTDANVFINMSGEYGDTGPRKLEDSSTHSMNKFERNQEDVFKVTAIELGKLKKVKIQHDNKGGGAAWFLGHVEVEDPKNKRKFYLPCQRWLATGEDDGQIARELVPVEKSLKKLDRRDGSDVCDQVALETKDKSRVKSNVSTPDSLICSKSPQGWNPKPPAHRTAPVQPVAGVSSLRPAPASHRQTGSVTSGEDWEDESDLYAGAYVSSTLSKQARASPLEGFVTAPDDARRSRLPPGLSKREVAKALSSQRTDAAKPAAAAGGTRPQAAVGASWRDRHKSARDKSRVKSNVSTPDSLICSKSPQGWNPKPPAHRTAPVQPAAGVSSLRPAPASHRQTGSVTSGEDWEDESDLYAGAYVSSTLSKQARASPLEGFVTAPDDARRSRLPPGLSKREVAKALSSQRTYAAKPAAAAGGTRPQAAVGASWRDRHKSARDLEISTDGQFTLPTTKKADGNDETDKSQSQIVTLKENTRKRKLKTNSSESEGSSDEDYEGRRIYSKDTKVYVKLVPLGTMTSKTGKKKKHSRTYDSYHYCQFCPPGQNVFTNFSQHTVRKHQSKPEVKDILELDKNSLERKRKIALLRYKGDHEHNLRVVQRGNGEIILGRRLVKESFNLANYGPCPTCLEWLQLNILDMHTCPENPMPQNKGSLITQSLSLSGYISGEASEALKREVLKIMLNDNIGKLARRDPLIIGLGNNWLERNVSNKLMRGSYTSSVMRLVAKLLLILRTEEEVPFTTNSEVNFISDYIRPQYFDVVVRATLKCSAPDSLDSLDTPSNAIKLGHELKRLCNIKYGIALANSDSKLKEECRDFLEQMRTQWSTKVTKLAAYTLKERKFTIEEQLPLPDDLVKLSKYMSEKLRTFETTDISVANYRYAVNLTQSKLLAYNRRRTGEIQATLIDTYKKRKVGVSEVGIEMTRELTDFEKYLLESQEVMVVRGKGTKGVPIIIPSECGELLKYLADPKVREAVGVLKDNQYLFAVAGGPGVYRGYNSLKSICEDAELQQGHKITSITLRKYMATMTQVLDLSRAELDWVCDHMGHNVNVHKSHYRSRSDVLERLEIAKILMIMDHGVVNKYVGKNLKDIQFEELAAAEVTSTPCFTDTAAIEDSSELIPELFDVLGEEDVTTTKDTVKRRKTRSQRGNIKRHRWQNEEQEEIKAIFKEFFKTKECPGKKDCLKAIDISRNRDGNIYVHQWEVLKKKVNNMIQKLNKI